MCNFRIGHGYDVHKLVDGRRLMLGGVEIPYERGLLGHSDADVLIHAVMDAVIGALGRGDIGKHFPDSDPSLEGVSSMHLLARTHVLLVECGAEVVNVDATLILERPKIARYIETMRNNIAFALGVESDRVNVKATTEEGLGFTGAGTGVAAHAVALIKYKGL